MKPLRIMVMLVLMLLFSALLYATDDDCIHYNALVCLPHDPQSIFEFERYGDFDQYESWTIRPPGCDESNEVCCQDAVGEDSFCCCRQLDCEIGSKRCFGDDMIQKCSDEFYPCIEWIPIKWCGEIRSDYRCQNAECVEIAVDGDQADGDKDLDSIVEDGDHTDADKDLDSIVVDGDQTDGDNELDSIVEDGDQTDADKDLDSLSENGDQSDADKDLDLISEDGDNKEQSSGGLTSNGCRLVGESTAVFVFIALLAFLAILRKNRSSDG